RTQAVMAQAQEALLARTGVAGDGTARSEAAPSTPPCSETASPVPDNDERVDVAPSPNPTSSAVTVGAPKHVERPAPAPTPPRASPGGGQEVEYPLSALKRDWAAANHQVRRWFLTDLLDDAGVAACIAEIRPGLAAVRPQAEAKP